jgi:hypothetical protein
LVNRDRGIQYRRLPDVRSWSNSDRDFVAQQTAAKGQDLTHALQQSSALPRQSDQRQDSFN